MDIGDHNDRSERYINAFAADSDLDKILCESDPSLSDDYWMDEIRNMSAVTAGIPTNVLTPKLLASMWRIGLETARNTLKTTAQSIIRQAVHLLEQRYKTAHKQFRYNQLNDRLM